MSIAKTPREIYAELFETVQAGRVFTDSKTFVDAVAKTNPEEVMRRYRQQRGSPSFRLDAFVRDNFELPESRHTMAASSPTDDIPAQIDRLWDKLTRAADQIEKNSSLIELPKAYVVPGGRFRELYYWDSYFTMLGLADSGRHRMLEDMVDNFAYLIDRIGFIPNGTRSYYCTRSQPPFFVLMLELLADVRKDASILARYAPQLKKEYEFWMAGADELNADTPAVRRVARIDDALLNRYWDDSDRPREESYAEDMEVAANADRRPAELYRDIRAACESGWDFSSRWFSGTDALSSICTTQILPVDLNSILHRVEVVLGDVSEQSGDAHAAKNYRQRAARRRAVIRSRFYDADAGFFFDCRLADGMTTSTLSLAAAFPLFFGLATNEQAASVAARLAGEFLQPGGWVTTLSESGQQWDSPNGWAPLQWIVHEGLSRYGFGEQAREGAARWLDNNIATFRSSGCFMEKYNVVEPGRPASGGEYAVQDGFGWTNGVLLSLLRK